MKICQIILHDYILRHFTKQMLNQTESNATLIDHIWCNKLQLYQFSIIIDTTTTDHFQTISTFITEKNYSSPHAKLNINEWILLLNIFRMLSIMTNTDVFVDFTTFIRKIIDLYNYHCLVK